MPRGSASFLLGFAFGVVTLSAFRHELHLTGDAELIGLFLLYGIGLVTVVAAWYRRVLARVGRKLDPKIFSRDREWAVFIWGSLLLFVSYFALILMVADF